MGRSKKLISRKQYRFLLSLIIALISILLIRYAPSVVKTEVQKSDELKVLSVEDGDTITVEMNGIKETIRLIGIDTPETKDPRKQVQCFGKAASGFTKNLIADNYVKLEKDNLTADKDRYNRLLRYVYVGNTLLNAEIISQGYGFAYTNFPFTKMEDFIKLEKDAESQKRGLWSQCDTYQLDSGQKQTKDD